MATIMKKATRGLSHRKVLAVCGAALGDFKPRILAKAYSIGHAIARSRAILITGATTGYPYEAARGACESGGMSIGISPAKSYEDHIGAYKKPIDVFEPIIFTGTGFFGRNPVIIFSAQAVIFIDGGTGSLNEFTVAYESHIPMGILKGSGGLENMIPAILAHNYKNGPAIIVESDPLVLVTRLLQSIGNK